MTVFLIALLELGREILRAYNDSVDEAAAEVKRISRSVRAKRDARKRWDTTLKDRKP